MRCGSRSGRFGASAKLLLFAKLRSGRCRPSSRGPQRPLGICAELRVPQRRRVASVVVLMPPQAVERIARYVLSIVEHLRVSLDVPVSRDVIIGTASRAIHVAGN